MRLHPVTVTIAQHEPQTGKTVFSRTHNNTAIAFSLDETNNKCFVVGLDDGGRNSQEFSIAGGVRAFTKFMHEGKATLALKRRNINLMISKAEPHALKAWMTSLATGKPPAPPQAATAGGASSSSSPRPASAPPKRHLAPSTPSRANAASSSSPGPQDAPRSKGKMVRPPGASPLDSAALRAAGLTGEQQEVLREVVLGGKSVFFTGGAGVGKSHLLRQIVARLDPRTTYVTASTGLAACAVGGVTVHHWAGIGGAADRSVDDIVSAARKRRGEQWRSARTLVIDEVSMLDGDLFDLLEEIARRVRADSRPFGGLQLVICGDFFQLPPVAKGGASFKFAFEARAWAACVPRTFELTRVFRQADDAFVAALNQIRMGEAPREVRELLKPCEGRVLADVNGIAATRLFTHKADCATLNAEELRKLPGAQQTFAARDEGRDAEALATLRGSCPAPSELTLKVGAQVILCKTLDAEAGLVNGARGVVTKFLAARSPSVRFQNGVERAVRVEAFGLAQGGAIVASRVQLPLSLGWAISVHKSQGMTLDRCALALRNVFECGQMYVALSRVRGLEGLALSNVDWSKCRAHPKVLAWHRATCA